MLYIKKEFETVWKKGEAKNALSTLMKQLREKEEWADLLQEVNQVNGVFLVTIDGLLKVHSTKSKGRAIFFCQVCFFFGVDLHQKVKKKIEIEVERERERIQFDKEKYFGEQKINCQPEKQCRALRVLHKSAAYFPIYCGQIFR